MNSEHENSDIGWLIACIVFYGAQNLLGHAALKLYLKKEY